MHPAIQLRSEKRRGCGFRKPGGLYLVSGGPSAPCGKLPLPLTVCPCCGGGIKFSRSWTWVNGTALLAERQCEHDAHGPFEAGCEHCPLSKPLGRCGLLWIGEQFYKTPADWTIEAVQMGVSRRIPAVPRDFEVGKTWVLVAHKKAIENQDGSYTAAIFHAFTPAAIEYVVKGDETDEEIEALVKRGITPVHVEKDESADLPLLAMAE